MRNIFQRIRWITVLAALAAAGATGCGMPKASDFKPSKLFSLDNAWPWGDDDELEIETPVRMVGLWTDTVLNTQNAKSQRGFGGRLLFYGEDNTKPVAVEGELVVYAFDETGREPTDNKPTRRYVFPADQVARHQSESPLGPSYSFWLPWDEAGGPQTEISLICRFQPKEGALVVSEQTRHLLPGALRPDAALASNTHPKLPEGVPSRPARPDLPSHSIGLAGASGAQLVSYEAPVTGGSANALPATAAAAAPEKPLMTTSIPLPQHYKLPNGPVPPRTIIERAPAQPAQVVPIVIQMPQGEAPAQIPVQTAAPPAGQMQGPTPLSATGYQPQQPPLPPTGHGSPTHLPMNAAQMTSQHPPRLPLSRLSRSPMSHHQNPMLPGTTMQHGTPMHPAGPAAVSHW